MYSARIPRVNIYLTEDLAEAARSIGLNVSSLTQRAIRQELQARRAEAWLDRVCGLESIDVASDAVLAALDAGRPRAAAPGG
ncbi:MAG: type II toxin-antitoxin system CcdA family antitoxin [Acidimicrobiales bacterium]